MTVATVKPHDFPLRLPLAHYGAWLAGRLREQGITFIDGLPVFGATPEQVETHIAPPWRMDKDCATGTVTVEQWPTPPAAG